MSTNPLNDISRVYLEQVAAVEEGVRPTPVDKPLDKAAFKKRRRSLAGKEKRAEAKGRGHQGKEWYNSGTTYSPDEAKRMRSKLDDAERRTRHRSAVDPDSEDDSSFSASKTKNPKKLRKQKAMGELGESSHLETDMKKRREANEKAVEDMKKTAAYKSMAAAARKKFDEALDPVGKEDADVDNDGKKNTKSDKYLLKRRAAIGKAITHKEALDPVGQEDADIDNDGDTDKSDKYLHKRRKAIGKAIAKKSVKEGYSNWRQDLAEVMTDDVDNKPIKEKKVNNKIKVNPDLKEAVEEIGGTLIEMVEIDEVDFVVESVYGELLEEGYEEDDIEEAIEYALTEARVTYGHDTKKPESGARRLIKTVGKIAREKLKSAVIKGARAVASGATKLADKAEGKSKPATAHAKPGTRSAKTYRGAGSGRVEKVSSPAPKPSPKKAEKPADPWEGSATTPPKAKKKKAAAPKAAKPKAPAATAPKRKRKSKLDDLLASVRSEQVQIDEKTLTKMEMKKREEIVKSMKDKASDFEKRYPGRGKEVMYATATKMAKKIAEQQMVDYPTPAPAPSSSSTVDKKKEMMNKQQLSNLKMLQQKKQQLERQKLQMQKSGKLPLEAN